MLAQIKQLPLQEEDRAFIHSIEAQANLENVTLGVFGAFSVGKSALINTLIEHEGLLPTHTNETTALPTYIVGGEEDIITAFYVDGREVVLTSEQLQQLKAGGDVEHIEYIHIQCAAPEWLKQFTLIDTPGRNTKYEAHVEASKQALITADAALYVMPWQGLSLEDVVYIKGILSYQPNLCFVINKVDEIDEAQGVTIEQLKMQVAQNLQEQLGQTYPVLAVSAKTGFNLTALHDEFIQPLKANATEVKHKRLQHALSQFLTREQQRVTQQFTLLTTALTSSTEEFEAKKRALAVQRERVQIDVKEKVNELQHVLSQIEAEAAQFVQQHYAQLENQLSVLATSQKDVAQLTIEIEDAVLTTRNIVYRYLQDQLKAATNEDVASALQSFNRHVEGFEFIEPNLETLAMQYESAKAKQIARIEQMTQRLNSLEPYEENDAERQQLEADLQALSEQAVEEFVPKMVKDPNFDPERAKKIANVIGFVGDIGVTVAAAIATSGVSAAAQAGGKVAAKETTKVATKAAIKKATVEVAEKAATEALKAATAKTAKKGGKPSVWVTGAQVLDKMTSPVQTIASQIGEQIDQNRKQPEKEDLHHRQTFFANKMKIEAARDEKLMKLNEMKEKAAQNERLKRELAMKLEKVEAQAKQEVATLERQYEQEKQRAVTQYLQAAIEQHITQLLTTEKVELHQWLTLQFDQLVSVVATMVPEQFNAQLNEWEQTLNTLESLKSSDLSTIEQDLEKTKETLAAIDQILGDSYAVQ